MESWKRKTQDGNGWWREGCLYWRRHRIAATLDQQTELVAGCFSQS